MGKSSKKKRAGKFANESQEEADHMALTSDGNEEDAPAGESSDSNDDRVADQGSSANLTNQPAGSVMVRENQMETFDGPSKSSTSGVSPNFSKAAWVPALARQQALLAQRQSTNALPTQVSGSKGPHPPGIEDTHHLPTGDTHGRPPFRRSASTSQLDERLASQTSAASTPTLDRAHGQPNPWTPVATTLFTEQAPTTVGSKRSREAEPGHPVPTIMRATQLDHVDLGSWYNQWVIDHPDTPNPTWLHLANGDVPLATCLFRRQLELFGVSFPQLYHGNRLPPASIDAWLGMFTITELADAIQATRQLYDQSDVDTPPAHNDAAHSAAEAHTSSSNAAHNAAGPHTGSSTAALSAAAAASASASPHADTNHTAAHTTPPPLVTLAPPVGHLGAVPGQPPQTAPQQHHAPPTAPAHTITVTQAIPFLRSVDPPSIARFVEDLRLVANEKITFGLHQCGAPDTLHTLGIQFAAQGLIQIAEAQRGEPGRPNPLFWSQTMGVERFIECLRLTYPTNDAAASGYSVVNALGRIRPDFGNVPQRASATKYVKEAASILDSVNPGSFSKKAAVNAMFADIGSTADAEGNFRPLPSVNEQLLIRLRAYDPPLTDPETFLVAVTALLNEASRNQQENNVWTGKGRKLANAAPTQGAPTPFAAPGPHAAPLATSRVAGQPSTLHVLNACDGKCKGCGRTYKGPGKRCPSCAGHPERNNSDLPFVDTQVYRDVAQRVLEGHLAHYVLPLKTHVDGSALSDAELAHMAAEHARENNQGFGPAHSGRGQPRGGPGGRWGGRFGDSRGSGGSGGRSYGRGSTSYGGRGGFQQGGYQGELATATTTPHNEYTAFPSVLIITPTTSLTVACLFDSGALQGNYVNQELAAWIQENGAGRIRAEGSCQAVNLAGTGLSVPSKGNIRFSVKFLNEVSKQFETLSPIDATILDSKYPLIIGRPLIRKFKIARKILSFFEEIEDEPGATPHPSLAIKPPPCTPREFLSSTGIPGVDNSRWEWWRQYAGAGQPPPVVRNQLSLIGNVKTKAELLPDCEPDIDYIEWPEDPFENFFSDGESLLDKIEIQGTLSAQRKIRQLCERFADIFAESVRSDPASVPPMEIKVDPLKWKTPRNRGPPRPQSNTKMQEIEKQIKKYLDLGVIKPVAAAEYSNIHMVPKPTPGEWRFCLDFVQLNAATEGTDGWPIPNITTLLNRIGARKATVFGVMDMTAGYHQAPISASSQIFTAFICYIGIFCWLRVPMGLKKRRILLPTRHGDSSTRRSTLRSMRTLHRRHIRSWQGRR